MRSISAALLASATLVLCARAGDLRNFEDAALHAIQFLDAQEGWAVGDDGVVWHTIDGGQNWERRPTGLRASLRSVHFLNPYTGWIIGREELPFGNGSVGVLLGTRDGGLHWQRSTWNALPGLNQVRFIDNKSGFVAGDGSDQFPTGVFATTDCGRAWKPVAGSRCTTWLAADFRDSQTGVLAGAWNRLATYRQGGLGAADVDALGGRNLYGVQLTGTRAVAVGQGGLVLISAETAGARWGYADLHLPTEVLASWDFHAVHCRKDHVWIVGRPGSVVLHSRDQGKEWEVLTTKQPLPLNGVFFVDDRRGWAVGEFGSILCTQDGGTNWRVQRRGGQRAAVLFVHSRSAGLPIDTVSLLGGQEGYLTAALRVTTADPASAKPDRATEGQRLAAAMRQAGGAAGEMLWQFPIPQHLAAANKAELVNSWDQLHASRAADELVRQLVLGLRMWRPSVVITDHPDPAVSGAGADALIAEAVHVAFERAKDPKAYPEQMRTMGLEPWEASKLYGLWSNGAGAQVILDLNEPSPRLEASARDFAAAAAGLLGDAPPVLPAQRYYRLLDSRLEGATQHRDIMEGVLLAAGGVARRELRTASEPSQEVLQAIRHRRNLQALAEAPASELTDPDKLLAQIGPSLKSLPADQGAPAAFALANQYVRRGQWTCAREVFLMLAERYPTHPLTADAYRWLIRLSASTEARRRHEAGQILLSTKLEFHSPAEAHLPVPQPGLQQVTAREGESVRELSRVGLTDAKEIRQWYQTGLDLGNRLAAFGPRFASDPSMQFCLQAARRNLGDFETARQWYHQFRMEHADGPWSDAAAAELWLSNRSGPPPKPVATCRRIAERPLLDGKLDDSCWEGVKPLTLRNGVGDTTKDYLTEVWLGYDKDFLYLALHCRHPENRYMAPVKVRGRDADLRPYDRVSLLLDLDRDYATCFHLQVDQRGCVFEDCWGDRSWDPRWFVAVHSTKGGWQIEAAIPLVELTGEPIPVGHAWACNIVRVLPGRGVQAFSTPADVDPRPEGMGLLIFGGETSPRKNPAAKLPGP